MLNFDQQGRTIAIAITAAALGAAAASSYWLSKSPAPVQTATDNPQKVCVAQVTRDFQQVMAQSISTQVERKKHLLDGIDTGDSAEVDQRIAQDGYADRLDGIRNVTTFCKAYIKCFPGKPAKATFDSCYDGMRPDDNDAKDEPNDDQSDGN